MKKVTGFIVNRLIGDDYDKRNADIRAKFGYLESITSTIVNSLLFVIKLALGIIFNSIALIADAFHTFSDIGTSVIIFVGFRIAKKPPDPGHPYGHGRAEYISTLIVSILIIVTGIEFIKASVNRILHPVPLDFSWGLIIAIFLTIVVKEILGQFSRHLGLMIDSDTLKADFWHHRTDAISSFIVLLALIGSPLGWIYLDGIAGLIVAAMLIWSGISLARNSVDTLIGQPPDRDTISRIRELARSVDGVIDSHDITIYNYGTTNFIGLHVEIDEKNSSLKSHDIAEDVQEILKEKMDAYATVHIDPIVLDSEEVREVNSVISSKITEIDCISSFHDLRIVHTEEHFVILFDIMGEADCDARDMERARLKLANQLQKIYPSAKILIEAAPIHAFK